MTRAAASTVIAFAQPTSKAAYDYWNALRNGQPLPRRREIDPAQLRALLPHITLLERVSAEQIHFRLAGTAVCQAFGRELRDHSLLSLWDAAHRDLIASALSASLNKASPLLLRFHGHALGRAPLPGEWLMLPLLDDRGAATRILASFASARDKFGAKAFTRLALLGAETIVPNRDRVEFTLTAPAPRPALTVVPTRGRRETIEALPSSTMSWPWAGLLREFLGGKES
jgi:hypothetical protein